jgi:arsenite methyltransferase
MQISACVHYNTTYEENIMEAMNKEIIRESVRENYGKIAESNKPASEIISTDSCCGTPGVTLDQMSTAMGYSEKDLAAVPEGINLGLGCGNPVALGSLKEGETVIDLGSGGGFDCFLAGKKVGDTGKVIGIDMTPAMVSKARQNAEKMGVTNVEFRLGEIEHLPVADNTANIIISNCVINLSPEKKAVFQDAYRALKPGGRLAISDILATQELPAEVKNDLALFSACIGGAATVESTVRMLEQAGFIDIKIDAKEESKKIINEWMPGSNAGDYIVSAYIEATKPE